MARPRFWGKTQYGLSDCLYLGSSHHYFTTRYDPTEQGAVISNIVVVLLWHSFARPFERPAQSICIGGKCWTVCRRSDISGEVGIEMP